MPEKYMIKCPFGISFVALVSFGRVGFGMKTRLTRKCCTETCMHVNEATRVVNWTAFTIAYTKKRIVEIWSAL